MTASCTSGDSGSRDQDLGSDQAPIAPSNLQGTAADFDQVDLNWTDNADNEDGFSIERAPAGGSFAQIATVDENVTGYSDHHLSAQTTYQYRARAYNSQDNSDYSNQIQVTTPAEPPVGTTSSITRHGITWTFNAPHQYGQFVNGDFWVVGPVTITSISHVSAAGVRDDLNGTMVNPRVIESQGYHPDSNNYDSNLDHSAQLPFTVTPGDSVVSTTGLEAIGGDEGTWLADAAVLTVADCAQASNKFRPPYTRPVRQSFSSDDNLIFSAGDINYALLPGLPAPATAPSLNDSARLVERVWLDHYPGEFLSSRIHPLNNMRDYGRDIAANVSEVAMQMMLNYDQEEIEMLVIRMIQLGIDLYGNYLDGRSWYAAGGHNSGRKFPIVFAGLLLNNTAMKTLNLTYEQNGNLRHYFHEDGQTYYYDDPNLAQYGQFLGSGVLTVVAGPGPGVFPLRGQKGWMDTTNGGDGDIALWSVFDWFGNGSTTYVYEHLHVDDWPPRDGGHDCPPKSEDYRACCTSRQWVGYALALRMMGGEAVSAWNHNAFFDYVYRFMEQDDENAAIAYEQHFAVEGYTYNRAQGSSGVDFIDELWDVYAGSVALPFRTN